MGARALVNPLIMLARRLKEGGRVPAEIRDHVNEVMRRVLIGSQTGFEFDTYAALAHKMLAYVEWAKAMSELCGVDSSSPRYDSLLSAAIRWRAAYTTAKVPAPALERLGVLRPGHKGGKALARRAQATWRERHKDDPNAPLPGSPTAGIGRFEPSESLPPETSSRSTAWERPADPDSQEEEDPK
jgi:hypothetical protein